MGWWYDLVKCVPVAGTVVSLCEAGKALVDGDTKTAIAKCTEAGISLACDVALVATAGTSSLATVPAKVGLVEGLKVIGKVGGVAAVNVGARKVTRALSDRGREGANTNLSPEVQANLQRALNTLGDVNGNSSADTAGDSSNDPPRDPTGGHNCQGADSEDDDYDYELDEGDVSNPVEYVQVGYRGRVERLRARIRFRHLRQGPRQGPGYTTRVKKFVQRMGRVQETLGHLMTGEFREGDEVGHIVGDQLGGPRDRTYNFFPQGPQCNMTYYHETEKNIYNFLVQENAAGRGHSANVELHVELLYVDYYEHLPLNRPHQLRVRVRYSNGDEYVYEISNSG